MRNQIEGCVIQTVSRTLKEEVKFNSSKVIRSAPAKVKAAVQSV